jgi:lipocalin
MGASMRPPNKVRNKFDVTFTASLNVETTIEVTDPKITQANLQAGLRSGKYTTSIIKGEGVVVTKSGRQIGKVIYVNTFDEEYRDFEVEDPFTDNLDKLVD